jgi:hypothetical protein
MKLKVIWQGFNRCRRRGMPFRVTVLLLLGVGPFIEYNMTDQHIPLINELVWTACRAIRNGCEPRVTSTLLRGYKAQENQRLLKLLQSGIADNQIKLNEFEQLELQKLPSKASLPILFTIAKRNNLLARDASLRRLNRVLLATAIGETALRFDNQWLEVKGMVYQKADLSKWSTWRSKIDSFLALFIMILPLPLSIALLWGIIFFTTAYVISGGHRLRGLRNIIAVIIPIVIFMLFITLNFSRAPSFFSFICAESADMNIFRYYLFNWNIFIYKLIFVVIATLYGMKLKRKMAESTKEPWVKICLLSFSGLIMFFPFGLYSNSWILPDILIFFWRGNLSGLQLVYSEFILPLEISGTIVLAYATLLLNKQIGYRNIKHINMTIAELGCYISWVLGGIVMLHCWVIKFFTKIDYFKVIYNVGSSWSHKNITIHFDINLALLVIALLIGFALPNFKKMSKAENITNTVMFGAMLISLLVIVINTTIG